MKGHWHTDAIHIGITALGVAIAFQVFRLAAGKLATSDNATVSNVGKSVGAIFSFPSST